MTITKKPSNVARTAAEFIAGAPDSENARRGVLKGKKRQITLTIMPELLEKVDALARKLGQSRAAVINMAVYRIVEHGLSSLLRKACSAEFLPEAAGRARVSGRDVAFAGWQ